VTPLTSVAAPSCAVNDCVDPHVCWAAAAAGRAAAIAHRSRRLPLQSLGTTTTTAAATAAAAVRQRRRCRPFQPSPQRPVDARLSHTANTSIAHRHRFYRRRRPDRYAGCRHRQWLPGYCNDVDAIDCLSRSCRRFPLLPPFSTPGATGCDADVASRPRGHRRHFWPPLPAFGTSGCPADVARRRHRPVPRTPRLTFLSAAGAAVAAAGGAQRRLLSRRRGRLRPSPDGCAALAVCGRRRRRPPPPAFANIVAFGRHRGRRRRRPLRSVAPPSPPSPRLPAVAGARCRRLRSQCRAPPSAAPAGLHLIVAFFLPAAAVATVAASGHFGLLRHRRRHRGLCWPPPAPGAAGGAACARHHRNHRMASPQSARFLCLLPQSRPSLPPAIPTGFAAVAAFASRAAACDATARRRFLGRRRPRTECR